MGLTSHEGLYKRETEEEVKVMQCGKGSTHPGFEPGEGAANQGPGGHI